MVSTTLNMTGEMALAGVARPRTGQCPNVSGWLFMDGAKYAAAVSTHPITSPTARGPS
jgi:hypothetical protein